MSRRSEPDARRAVVEAARRLRESGHDGKTVASLFLNGAALLLSERVDEEAFVELCRSSWRASERQAELCRLIDRAVERKPAAAAPSAVADSMTRAGGQPA